MDEKIASQMKLKAERKRQLEEQMNLIKMKKQKLERERMASLETLEKYKTQQDGSSVGALASAKTDNPNLPADPYNTV